jgi:carbamoyltransferase
MIVLGINPGWDSTAALVVDGKIVAVVEEERLSRVKMHLGFPRRAISEVLRLGGVDASDVDRVTFSFVDYLDAHPAITNLLLRDKGFPFDPENHLEPVKVLRSLASVVGDEPGVLTAGFGKSSSSFREQNTATYLRTLRELGIEVDRLSEVDHHLSHAASAYFCSGFDDCLVVTADGCGDGRSATVSLGRGGRIQTIADSDEDRSPGFLYSSVTSFLGFRAHRHEGKITGLAAYGDPNVSNGHFEPCLRVTSDGRGFTSQIADAGESWIDKTRRMARIPTGGYYRKAVLNGYEEYYRRNLAEMSREDVAAGVQARLEQVMIEYLQPLLRKTGATKLALAGGVFANVKLNQRLYEMDEVDEVYVHPNMGDGGNAVGSALQVFHEENPGAEPTALEDVYLGPSFDEREIEAELRRRDLPFTHHPDIEAKVAERIAAGGAVGRFNGRMEYGPRALGNRSILANPTDPTINDVLNARLHRTEFMPFAPSVLAEDAEEYFGLSNGSRRAAEFMTITCDVDEKRRAEIPAVTHVDGTARPQLVRSEINPSYHRIISEFKKQTGLSAVINTSFNIHEQPIVCTPADACIAYEQGSVDALAIGEFLVEK